MAHIRREVYFSGRVQGVGFRFTAQHISRDFEVTGYVRNLPDGRVHLLAEGATDEIEAYVTAIRDRMGTCITNLESEEHRPTHEFNTFAIRT